MCSKEDAQVIFRDAAAEQMTGEGYVWIVTEQALNAKNVPAGALGLRLLYAQDEQKHLRVRRPGVINMVYCNAHFRHNFLPSHLQDSVYVLASAINQMNLMNETITESPKDCEDSGVLWDSGKMIFQYLKTRNIRGETGQVAFDDNGDRINAEYEVVNALEEGQSKVVGRYFYDEVISNSIAI